MSVVEIEEIIGVEFRDDVAVAYITPSQAEELLKFNTHNRPKSSSGVRRIAKEIASGNYFDHNNDMITFDDDVLTNGQHRLSALALLAQDSDCAGNTYRCVFQINSPQNIYMDSNRTTRSAVANADLCGEFVEYQFSNAKLVHKVMERAYEQTEDGYEARLSTLTIREQLNLIHKSQHSSRKIGSLESVFEMVSGNHPIIHNSPTANYIKACFYNIYRNGLRLKDVQRLAELYMNPSLCEEGTSDYTIYSLCKYLETNQGGCREFNELRIKAFDCAVDLWIKGIECTDLSEYMLNTYGKGMPDYKNKWCKFR